jgi:hypothetical protein
MATKRVAQIGSSLRQRVGELPDHGARAWKRISTVTVGVRARAATWIAPRSGIRGQVADPQDGVGADADAMTKGELMELARKEQIKGRSSMSKAQLAAALRKSRRS